MSLISRFRRLFGGAFVLCIIPSLATGTPLISKSYGYFNIDGKTAEDLDRELERHGPLTKSTGHRHPGATEIKFGGDVTYVERDSRCSIGGATVTLRTHLILPRWSNRRRADKELRFIWDTLSADIKRHEERHAEIARTHARKLEKELLRLRSSKKCADLEKRVASTTRRVLDAHDRDQIRFDRVETKNFDTRMMRLLNHRLQRTNN